MQLGSFINYQMTLVKLFSDDSTWSVSKNWRVRKWHNVTTIVACKWYSVIISVVRKWHNVNA